MASRAENAPSLPQQSRLSASMVERIVSLAVLAAVCAAIVFGWLHRHDAWIDPSHGFGYALGIIGGSLMLILLAYPVRKRVRPATRAYGTIGFWFRLHMFLGLVGPLAILYHSRFTWGALNSAFALGSMIVVASSGLVGRFFYSRVHRGYSGRKLEMRALKREMDEKLAAMESRGFSREALLREIQPFEDRAVAAGSNFWSSAGAVVGLGIETRRAKARLHKALPGNADRRTARLRDLIDEYFEAVRRAAEFAFYDRLLRLWHLLHLPLFVLLVAAAVLHIVAVHMY
ncbi:MAG: hypothetical protein KGL44_04150 [Sphingomonadales bacterium]|nr:hypothetical protein [Sphingomonadales bacterium]